MKTEPDTKQWPPEKYKLHLYISATGLKAHLLPVGAGEELLLADLTWERDASQTLRHIEDAVYEEHMPIDVYATEVIIRPEKILVAPADAAQDDDLAEDVYAAMFVPEGDKLMEEVACQVCGDIVFLYGLPRGLQGFLERTFSSPAVDCTLALMYKRRVDTAKSGQHMYVDVRADCIDVLAFISGTLQIANTFSYKDPADAVYYILNAWQSCRLSQLQGHLHLHPTEPANVNDIRTTLNQYINHVSVE